MTCAPKIDLMFFLLMFTVRTYYLLSNFLNNGYLSRKLAAPRIHTENYMKIRKLANMTNHFKTNYSLNFVSQLKIRDSTNPTYQFNCFLLWAGVRHVLEYRFLDCALFRNESVRLFLYSGSTANFQSTKNRRNYSLNQTILRGRL